MPACQASKPLRELAVYQQRVVGRRLAILVLPTNNWPTIRFKAGEIAAKVAMLKPGDFVELSWLNP